MRLKLPVSAVEDAATQRALRAVQKYVNDVPVGTVSGIIAGNEAAVLAQLLAVLAAAGYIKNNTE